MSEVFEKSLEEILYSEKEVDELEEEFKKVYEEGGLAAMSHLYGLNERINQFEELFQAYREFYNVQDFRDGSRIKEKKLNNLMEAYRNYFGPGSNEQWNKGVDAAKMLAGGAEMHGPLTRQDFQHILEGEY
ncbi:MAG: hypothetical protein ABEK10_02685 [Candidatus Nanosalina sp.]